MESDAKPELNKFEIPPDRLRLTVDPGIFRFKCTEDLVPIREFIGQTRATKAIEFGLNIHDDGFNIYVSGLSGTGKTTIVKRYIDRLIKSRTDFKPLDWCYVYNFREADAPRIASLPQGKGKVFQRQISELLDHIKEDLGKSFASDEYKAQRDRLVEDTRRQQQKDLEQLGEEARSQGFSIQVTPMGPALIPVVDGRPMQEAEWHALPEDTRKTLEARQDDLRKKLQASFEKAEKVERDVHDRLHKLDKDIGDFAISRLFQQMLMEYGSNEKLKEYLAGLKGYTLDNLAAFKAAEEPVNPLFGMPMSQVAAGRDPFMPFKVNVFVDNSEQNGPPVIVEQNPNFGNMFGKIERRFVFGAYISDPSMIKAGAVSRANGGYLLLSAQDVLTNPGVWPAFKRAIKNKEVRVEDPYEQFGFIAPQVLRPEPMPIDVKFVLIGDPMLYQMLAAYDEDFWEIFRVKADFDFEVDRNENNMMDYAAFISGCCEKCKARHFDPSGVAKVIEHSSRMVSDREKMSSRFGFIKELIEESDYWASLDGKERISAEHVQKAIDERHFRHNLIEQHIREMIKRGTIMIDTEGAVVGQVNGLSVMGLGDVSFGRPSRITAKTFLGRGGVLDIERETDLGGRIHSKGVMILGGYLGWKYAQDKPLSLSASLCFEQSYEGVEGDSASSAELYSILSSLSEVPLKQSIAVTGSVNQKGEVQPIGGANEKIEGFYHVCKEKGLTGEQGAMLPYSNLDNLMLREEVVDAVRQGQFHIYAVKTIDEGIEVLTGVAAGEKKPDGTYPEGTINCKVNQRLKGMAETLKEFAGTEEWTSAGNGHRTAKVRTTSRVRKARRGT
ncbi:MAG: AAA family ATPase [Chloroflexi bacterium]|nr:AAA family ATPase [Chloroflexota bacterium]